MTRLDFLTSLVLTLLIFTTASAQLPPPIPESKDEKEKAQKELERKALKLLDDTLEATQGFKLAENRALIQSQAADLLWKRDEKRARELFQEAMTGISDALRSASGRSSRDMSYWTLTQLRYQIVQMIAARDPQMALDLLHSTRPASDENPESVETRRTDDQELRLEQSIALQAAEGDPKRALQMAQESLNKGVTMGLLGVLQRLQQKDAEAATRLAGEIVKKLQAESPRPDTERSYVAMELLRYVLMPQAQQNAFIMRPSAKAAEKAKPLSLDDQTIRDLAGYVVSAALKSPMGGPNMLMQLQPMLPELDKRMPERAAQLRQKIGELNQSLDPMMKAWMQFESLARGGSTDALLEAAAKAPAEMRAGLYTMAAMKLMQSGDTDRARQIITENMSGQERDRMLTQLDRVAVARDLEQGKIEEAKQFISSIRSKERRASTLAQLAAGLAAKGDRKTALLLLDEARGLINRQPDNQKEIETLLEVARGYAMVDPAQTFELIDPLIDRANEMLSAAALLEKFGSGQGLFKKGEMILQPGFSNMSGMYAHFIRALAELARVNFDRTRATADRFGRDEVRVMARLIIAQSILSDRIETINETEGMGGFFGGAGIVMGY
jgi:hypothetical protein